MHRLKQLGWRGALVASLLLLIAAAAVAAPRLTHAHSRHARDATLTASDSLRTRYLFLSHQHSNRCGMPATAIAAMPADSHLQGSCCFPMNYAAYVKQRHEITRYADVTVIPKDPYDVPVSLARRLIGYQRIKLTAAEQHVYDQAKPLSETKGPCCCPCWRWTAFGGQAKYLITHRHYSAPQIAVIWSVEEGCGGPSDNA